MVDHVVDQPARPGSAHTAQVAPGREYDIRGDTLHWTI
jgi:hypothetical protein